MNKRNVLFWGMALVVMVMSGCLTTGSQEVVEVNVVPSNPAPFAWPQEGLQGMGKGTVRQLEKGYSAYCATGSEKDGVITSMLLHYGRSYYTEMWYMVSHDSAPFINDLYQLYHGSRSLVMSNVFGQRVVEEKGMPDYSEVVDDGTYTYIYLAYQIDTPMSTVTTLVDGMDNSTLYISFGYAQMMEEQMRQIEQMYSTGSVQVEDISNLRVY